MERPKKQLSGAQKRKKERTRWSVGSTTKVFYINSLQLQVMLMSTKLKSKNLIKDSREHDHKLNAEVGVNEDATRVQDLIAEIDVIEDSTRGQDLITEIDVLGW
jgi:hypothetical protein